MNDLSTQQARKGCLLMEAQNGSHVSGGIAPRGLLLAAGDVAAGHLGSLPGRAMRWVAGAGAEVTTVGG